MSLLLVLIFLSSSARTALSAHCSTAAPARTFEKCITLPTQQASVAWTFHAHNATLDLVFFGTFISPSGWVGWGINPSSAEMTGTRALIAFPDPQFRPVDIHLLSSSATLYGGKMATLHNGAAVQIYATLKLERNKTKIHLVWNRGLYVQGAAHKDDARTLKIAHGILNAVSWGVLLPIGAVTARYLRHVQALGPAWFYAHAGIQLSALLIGAVGFSIGIRLGELSPGVVYGLHRKLGFAAFSIGALQTLALLFRPKTTNKFRKYWKSYHHFVGYACVVLGVVNVFQGFEVMGESRSYAKLGYCLCLSTLIGVCIALEVNSWVVFCRKSKEEKLRRERLIGGSDKESGIHG
ncbi:CYTOCHROME B561 AND DOMON DOMAIN-CONTAINING PROTEIN [Salix koriyanagi]|uniref:CYTOCHROME B561 AND DOMON DOMAIN-CONTAINING PROTEIN n=1 Tax=Salix koriyanagi TaxID=2511006 RepID=A0A9Q0TFK5_9ROSI|nr:CYTOCHROME B561 AND DOMON DOMAIN-CONTAINING PROTEIN [Salix koriyanagi]